MFVAEALMKSESSLEMDALFPKALDGFMLVLSANGDMVYLSENVTDYLGVSQVSEKSKWNTNVFIHVHINCTTLFRKIYTSDRKKGFNEKKMFTLRCTVIRSWPLIFTHFAHNFFYGKVR